MVSLSGEAVTNTQKRQEQLSEFGCCDFPAVGPLTLFRRCLVPSSLASEFLCPHCMSNLAEHCSLDGPNLERLLGGRGASGISWTRLSSRVAEMKGPILQTAASSTLSSSSL